MTQFFKEVLMAEEAEPVVIFVDEIDSTLSLDFTDDFFAAIRYLYVARAQEPVFQRLSFVLIGVATPGDLIQDPKRTPFNVGQRVDLADFTLAEALPLAAGLGLPESQAEQVMGWVLKWTGGHPYLTQRLCGALVENQTADIGRHYSEGDVDRVVSHTFLGAMSEQDNNLQFVRDMLTKRAPNIFEVLTTYQAVRRNRLTVADEEQSIVKSHLKLAGVVKREGKALKMRNAVYKTVFDDRWINGHFPINWPKRLQRAAVTLIGLVLFSSVPLAGFGWWQAGEAGKQRTIAEQKAIEANQQREIAEQQRANAEEQRLIAQDAEKKAKVAQKAETNQRLIAEKLRGKAETARGVAEQRRQQAETAQQDADQQRATAEQQGQIAVQQRNQATAAKDEANKAKLAQSLSAQALALRDTFPQRSLLLAVESIKPNILSKTDAGALLRRLLGEIGGSPLIGHAKPVVAVAFTPDGKRLATGSQDGTVRLWDKVNPDRPPMILSGTIGEIKAIAISPDGQWLAAIGIDAQIKLWNLANANHPLTLTGHAAPINTLAFSPDSQWLATASQDTTVRLWDMKAAAPGARQIRLEGHTSSVTKTVFSASGKWLATAEADYKDGKSIRLWDMTTLSPLPKSIVLQGQPYVENHVSGLAFSPDEKHLAAGISYSLQMWDLTAKNLADTSSTIIGTNNGYIYAITFSPDNRWLATSSNDLKLWDLRSLDPTQPRSPDCQTDAGSSVCRVFLKGHTSYIVSLNFSPQGKWLASASTDGTARLWDITDLSIPPVVLRGHEGGVNAIAFDAEGQWLATASQDHQARLWKVPDAVVDPIVYRDSQNGVAAVALSPEWGAVAGRDQIIRLWSRTDPHRPPLLLPGHTNYIRDLAFSHNGHWLASTGDDGTARLWKMTAANPATNPIVLQGHSSSIDKLAISPNDHWLATGSWDTTIRLWDLTAIDPSVNSRILSGHRSAIRSLAFSRDGKYLVSGSGDGYHTVNDVFALVWDLNATDPSAHPIKLSGHQDIIAGVDISPDNRWVATAGWDSTVRLWDLTAANPANSAKVINFDPVGRVGSVTFSPDGHWLAAGSWNNQAQVQDMTQLTQAPYKLLGHQGRVFDVRFSPDGQWLATSGEDHRIRLWNPKELQAAPIILRGHEAVVHFLSFSADSRWLLSGGTEGNDARLWRVSGEDLITIACRTAGRNLTPEEWQQFLPGQPYRPTCPALSIPKNNNPKDRSASIPADPSNLLITLLERIQALWH
jgi:WD40 repeat protein